MNRGTGERVKRLELRLQDASPSESARLTAKLVKLKRRWFRGG